MPNPGFKAGKRALVRQVNIFIKACSLQKHKKNVSLRSVRRAP